MRNRALKNKSPPAKLSAKKIDTQMHRLEDLGLLLVLFLCNLFLAEYCKNTILKSFKIKKIIIK